jgi:hypothetical protein
MHKEGGNALEFLDINIQENDDKFGMIQKLSSLLDKLKKITSGLARYCM